MWISIYCTVSTTTSVMLICIEIIYVYQESPYIFLDFIWIFLHLFSFIFHYFWISYIFLWLYLAHGLFTILFVLVYLVLCSLITALRFILYLFSATQAVSLIGTALVCRWHRHWFVYIPWRWLSLFQLLSRYWHFLLTILFSFDIGFGYRNCHGLCTLPF